MRVSYQMGELNKQNIFGSTYLESWFFFLLKMIFYLFKFKLNLSCMKQLNQHN